MSILDTKTEVRYGGSGDSISLSGVSFGFKDKEVLKDINLGLNESEVLALIGPSGTGKTTLLRVLSFFYKPDVGRVVFDGEDVWSVSERERLSLRRRVGMVFQTPNLFDSTVYQNVRYGLKVRQSWRNRLSNFVADLFGNNDDQRVVEKLGLVGLEGSVRKDSSSLSGGEAQRVAFARALAYEPDFLLLDEPTSDLDPHNTLIIENAVKEARSQGIGVAVATHDMHQAERIADRVAVLINGSIIEVGDKERIFNNPRNEKTRKFINGELVY